MDLSDIRSKIDIIDFEILKLLNSRMEYALRTKKFKRDITDEKRESEVLEYIRKHSQGLIEPDFCKRLFLQVIAEAKRLQMESLRLIGFQGEHGTFSEMAAALFDPALICISCAEHREVFEAVDSGLLHYGVVPVESTLGDTVPDVNEFLVDRDLHISGEVRLPIQYCLLALPETDPNEIRVVYSSRHALSQCQIFLTKRGLEGRPYYDAAGAARMLLRERPKGSAAIASRYAAEFYNLAVLEGSAEDHHNSFSRFLILSKGEGDKEGSKCSIVFSTEDKAGALFNVLKEFAAENINLTRIESVPKRDETGNYLFFVDFHGSDRLPGVQRALERVRRITPLFKFLGCYPGAK